jgi:hypothetical protein
MVLGVVIEDVFENETVIADGFESEIVIEDGFERAVGKPSRGFFCPKKQYELSPTVAPYVQYIYI